ELQASGEAQYGLALQTGDTYHNFPVISAYGGYIFGRTEDGGFDVSDIGIASEGGIAAAEWLSGMYTDGLMPTNVDSVVAFALFEEGETAMLITGPWFSQRIVDTGVNYSIDPLPGAEGISEQGSPFLGAQGVFISAFGDNQLLAEEFVYGFFATQDTMQAIYDNDPRIPAWLSVDTSTDPNAQAFLAAGTNAIPMPAIPEMSAVWAAAGDALNLISQGEDPVATFDNANEQIIAAIALVQSEDRIVGVPGSYQDEAGCEADWNPACEVTFMEAQGDGIYTLTVTIPAGEYEYKVAMNGAWDENYGADGVRDGDNIVLSLSEETEVTFTYDDTTNVITDSVNNPE
ncbi:MAG: extracellular solute-binding protein, partial [Anaerolineae bacterium]|nr:extracellular solute-binding protein [Anaerolineae bacterium]